MFTLCFTRYTLKISNFCEHIREYKWDLLSVNWTVCNMFCGFNWYQFAGDCTHQLPVNVTGYMMLAQRLHTLRGYMSATKNAPENTIIRAGHPKNLQRQLVTFRFPFALPFFSRSRVCYMECETLKINFYQLIFANFPSNYGGPSLLK